MRRLPLILALALCPLLLQAQQLPEKQIREILGRLDSDRVSLEYDCETQGASPLHLSGIIILQGNCYFAKGNGMEIYCDGQTRWTVDPEEKEVYIEHSGGIREILDGDNSLKSLSLKNIKYIPQTGGLRDFRFDSSSLDSSWVVTDLREE